MKSIPIYKADMPALNKDKVNMFAYLAQEKSIRPQLHQWVISNGGQWNPRNENDLARLLARTSDGKIERLYGLAQLHPDYKLIITAYQKTLNGQMSADGDGKEECYSCTAEGCKVKSEPVKNAVEPDPELLKAHKTVKTAQIVMITGAVLITAGLLVYVAAKVSKN